MRVLRTIMITVLLTLLTATAAVQAAHGNTPQGIKMQGYLTDRSGELPEPADGTYTITFDLYDDEFAGSLIASSGALSVVVSAGMYDVDLPFTVTHFGEAVRYIEITVAGETLAPRVKVASAPFAYMAERLDGMDSAEFAEAVHEHAGDDIMSGTVGEAVIDSGIARDSEVMPMVLAGDGSGSGLDADLLDGNESSAFLLAGSENWVDTSGDTMTGPLVLGPGVSLDLGGEMFLGGGSFLHTRSTDGLALGVGALQSTAGFSNTAIGKWAMRDNTTGRLNVALGTNALRANADGDSNVAIGVNALLTNLHGYENISIGFESGRDSQGSFNTFIGKWAGLDNNSGSGNLYLGAGGVNGENNTIRIGSSSGSTVTYMGGIRGRTTGEPDALPVVIDSNGQLGTVPSILNADPPCFDNSNRFVDCGNGTVTDTVTGLIWMKDAGCFGIGHDWANANTTAAALAHGQCSLTDNSSPGDWRLPTKAEWEGIVKPTCGYPAFPDTSGWGCYATGSQWTTGIPWANFWSSTPINPGEAWYVQSNTGNLPGYYKTAPDCWVWPVREWR